MKGNAKISIKRKLLLLLTLLFLFFSLFAWIYSSILNKQLNEAWAERFIKKQVLFDKYRTLLPIMREVALVKTLAHESALKEMALDEQNSTKKEAGIAFLEKNRLKFKDGSYFIAFVASKNYYFNDIDDRYKNAQFRYRLSETNKDDAWFFTLLGLDETYQINVNKDTLLGTTNVWINYMLKDNGKTVAVLGTGLDLSAFLKESVDIEQEGIRNIFINQNMAIQLERDSNLIDHASLVQNKTEHKELELLIKEEDDLNNIKALMQTLKSSGQENQVKTLWVSFESGEKLVGLAYLKELGWYNLTIIDPQELTLINHSNVFVILTLLFSFSLLIVNSIYNKVILRPLRELQNQMLSVEHGSYNAEINTTGGKEIVELSERFKKLLAVINANNKELEEKIKQRTLSLKENEEKLNTILNTIEAYIYIKDLNHKYVYVNKHVCTLFSKKYDEIMGKDDTAFIDALSAKQIFENDESVMSDGLTIKEEESRRDAFDNKRVYLSIKTPLRNEEGTIYGLCGISTDISERIDIEEKNRHLAFYDHLTDLPNRRLFDDRLLQALSSTKRNGVYGCVMFLDLDNFKPLNDTYGHEVGDQLLVEVASRLRACVREVDTVARFGGDEFIVLISAVAEDKISAKNSAKVVAQKISSSIAEVYHLSIGSEPELVKIQYSCSVSIGVALFKGEKLSKDALLLQADEEMYNAKKAGKNSISFYENPNI
ncbi:MAG: diguanylate cyclase [Sulfurimonas sp.]|nr:diguanylate cyclase [Sulfurimonas sp.]